MAPASVREVGVTMNERPRKRAGSAAENPDASVPAIGWPPTKKAPSAVARSPSRTIPDLTLPASVRTVPGRIRGPRRRIASTARRTGTHTITMSHAESCDSVQPRAIAPTECARRTVSFLRSHPHTSGAPRFPLRAIAREPPISPRPRMPTRSRATTLQRPPHRLGHFPQPHDHLRERLRPERLGAVGERLLRLMVDLDHQAVRPRCDRGGGERLHQRHLPG